jgi:hypothetical protein
MESFDLSEIEEKTVINSSVILDYFAPVIVVCLSPRVQAPFDLSQLVYTKGKLHGFIDTRVDSRAST